MPEETVVDDKGGLHALLVRGAAPELVGLMEGRIRVPKKFVSFAITGVPAPPIDLAYPVVFLIEAGVDHVKGICEKDFVTIQPSGPMKFDESHGAYYFEGGATYVHQVTVWHGNPDSMPMKFSHTGRAAGLKFSW